MCPSYSRRLDLELSFGCEFHVPAVFVDCGVVCSAYCCEPGLETVDLPQEIQKSPTRRPGRIGRWRRGAPHTRKARRPGRAAHAGLALIPTPGGVTRLQTFVGAVGHWHLHPLRIPGRAQPKNTRPKRTGEETDQRGEALRIDRTNLTTRCDSYPGRVLRSQFSGEPPDPAP